MTNIDKLPYVEAELNYLAPMVERPRYYAYEPDPGEPRSNLTPEPHQIQIHSLRPIADELGLDVQGFALLEQRSAVRDFWDDDEVRRVYYPEAERFLKEATGASRIFIFDHLQRRRVPGQQDRSRSGPRQPATRVHVDHTARLLLKIADTKTDISARFMPHTSFTDPTTPPDAFPRESIELRTLVFHPA